MTLDKTFYDLLYKQEVVAAPVTSKVSHSLMRLLSEIQ